MTAVYDPRVATRSRRTKNELQELDNLLIDIVRNEHPLTVRRAFYVAVSAGGIDKTEAGYNTIKRRMLALRRARRIPYSWVTDGTRYIVKPRTWNSPADALTETARLYRLDLWARADTIPQVFVEKDAIAAVIQPSTDLWGVALGVLRGYPSETFAWSVAASLDPDRRHVLYQLGDHDPSGVDAWRAFTDRVGTFAAETKTEVEFVRLAVTPAQIVELDLPTRPTKKTDTRSSNFDGPSVEVDTVPTGYLQQLVQEAIASHVDAHELEVLEVAEQQERHQLEALAAGWGR